MAVTGYYMLNNYNISKVYKKPDFFEQSELNSQLFWLRTTKDNFLTSWKIFTFVTRGQKVLIDTYWYLALQRFIKLSR